MDITKNFGKRLQELRNARGLTQAQLAEQVGLDTMSISRIETGARFPQKENIEKLAEVLNCEVKELFNYNHHKTKTELRDEIDAALDKAQLKDLKYFKKMMDIYLEAK